MAYQAVFKRFELKYLLTQAQKQRILEAMEPHMALDQYGRTTIRNIYLDTDTYRLIRRSIERPAYKEKIRLRSYRRADSGRDIFVELKKKCKGVVFKRRLTLPESQALCWASGTRPAGQASQIADEIDYFIRFYGVCIFSGRQMVGVDDFFNPVCIFGICLSVVCSNLDLVFGFARGKERMEQTEFQKTGTVFITVPIDLS